MSEAHTRERETEAILFISLQEAAREGSGRRLPVKCHLHEDGGRWQAPRACTRLLTRCARLGNDRAA